MDNKHSVANTTDKPRIWDTFDPVLTHKNYEKQVVRRGLAPVWRSAARIYMAYGLSGAAVWEALAFFVFVFGNTE